MKKYTLSVQVPLTHAETVRQAIGDAGGGKAGAYSHCSFSVRGTGRFRANEEAKPYIGQAGSFEQVEEERIIVSHIGEDVIREVVAAMKKAHPYEETAYEIVEILAFD